MSGPHPYLFLRDTVKLNDLKSLLHNKHAYVRTYAFGALSHRNEPNLLSVIIDNLKDTVQIEVMSGDVVFNAYPVELMMEYEYTGLSSSDKKKLKTIVSTKYKHLIECLKRLEDNE